MPSDATRDHGGRLDAAVARFGGTRADWIDLSTGINPVPYPIGHIPPAAWTDLPDARAGQGFLDAVHSHWAIPQGASVLAVPGLSSVIAQIPYLVAPAQVRITHPTYNEHAAAFHAAGWEVVSDDAAKARVAVHPNNPDGRWFDDADTAASLSVIDESFCDPTPDRSLIHLATRPGTLILKSFGKFWGLAGLRLGVVIGDPALVAALAARIGPWPVSGPALEIGTIALTDPHWTSSTIDRLTRDAARLDTAVLPTGATLTGGTPLFRLYDHPQAADLHHHLAEHHIWSRVFPWSATALRLGLPGPDDWPRVVDALERF
jgi:cobalamin biosynthetic protein CobC